ncbi:MAG: trehalose-phosphatase [Acidobacteriaceae bacterium]|nr:trehalose-phosphatase [Acidobacteriaceae bacterium]
MGTREIEAGLPDSPVLSEFLDRLTFAQASVLLLDYDGTLAPFRMERDRAYPYPGVVSLLEQIVNRKKTRTVIISGRPVAEVKDLLSPLNGIEMWGAHGLERISADGIYQQAPIPWNALELLSKARDWVIKANLIPLAEVKPGGIAIHWRGMPQIEVDEVEARLMSGWALIAESPELKLLQFESGLELRVAHPDKGNAVEAIMEESGSTAEIAYLGDDLTDEDSFQALNGHGLTVLVRPEYRQTAAQLWIRPPGELIEFLQQWLSRIR